MQNRIALRKSVQEFNATQKDTYFKRLGKNKQLLIIFLPVIIYYVIFHYLPMIGILIAFKDFKGFSNLYDFLTQNWVGFRWFKEFFSSVYFFRLLRNTFLLSFYSLIWGFPVPIIFALLLNEVGNGFFKRFVQTASYLPYFISTVIVVGMIVNFLSPSGGIINILLEKLGYEPIHFMMNKKWFRTIYVASGIWQGFGFSSIIYIAALSGIDPNLYEAAEIDGAGRFRKIVNISIPSILPTIVILLILSLGQMMNVGFEKIILMYNPSTYEVADVIQTYVYRAGIINAQFSFASAVGLFNSVVNFILLITVNKISKKVSEISLW
ncbi:MAG: sugar ABC transporter permease [Firmicutes bacterium]|nr:sugar ABC transporter permease [Bacillota bacterium]